MRAMLLFISRAQIVVAILAATLLLAPPRADEYGDRLQIALPLLAWACAGSQGTGAEYVLRYGVMLVTAHASKRMLGEAPINQRPNGNLLGFPSAHTSTAVLGASTLAHQCLSRNSFATAVVVAAAAFVGASRIEADAHTIWQVLAGAVLGYACDRALRRNSPGRTAVIRVLSALRTGFGRGLRAGAAAVVRFLAGAVPGAAVRLRSVRRPIVPLFLSALVLAPTVPEAAARGLGPLEMRPVDRLGGGAAGGTVAELQTDGRVATIEGR